MFVGILYIELLFSVDVIECILCGEFILKGFWNLYISFYFGRVWIVILDFMEKGDIIFKFMILDKIGFNEVGDFLSKMSKREINFNKILVEM